MVNLAGFTKHGVVRCRERAQLTLSEVIDAFREERCVKLTRKKGKSRRRRDKRANGFLYYSARNQNCWIVLVSTNDNMVITVTPVSDRGGFEVTQEKVELAQKRSRK